MERKTKEKMKSTQFSIQHIFIFKQILFDFCYCYIFLLLNNIRSFRRDFKIRKK
jgi:hypothetical protein